MVLSVQFAWDAHKIFYIVVAFVFVHMVNVEAFWNRPIKIPPHITVKPFSFPLVSRLSC